MAEKPFKYSYDAVEFHKRQSPYIDNTNVVVRQVAEAVSKEVMLANDLRRMRELNEIESKSMRALNGLVELFEREVSYCLADDKRKPNTRVLDIGARIATEMMKVNSVERLASFEKYKHLAEKYCGSEVDVEVTTNDSERVLEIKLV